MSVRVKASAGRRAQPADGKQKLRLWLRLLRTTRAIEAQLRERLRLTFETTMPRFDVLAALARHERGMTMTALSRHLIVSNGNVTGIIDRLVADGLVVRVADRNDRRATFVRLTREGARQFAIMAAAHETWVGELLAGVAPADAEAIMNILEPSAAAPTSPPPTPET